MGNPLATGVPRSKNLTPGPQAAPPSSPQNQSSTHTTFARPFFQSFSLLHRHRRPPSSSPSHSLPLTHARTHARTHATPQRRPAIKTPAPRPRSDSFLGSFPLQGLLLFGGIETPKVSRRRVESFPCLLLLRRGVQRLVAPRCGVCCCPLRDAVRRVLPGRPRGLNPPRRSRRKPIVQGVSLSPLVPDCLSRWSRPLDDMLPSPPVWLAAAAAASPLAALLGLSRHAWTSSRLARPLAHS